MQSHTTSYCSILLGIAPLIVLITGSSLSLKDAQVRQFQCIPYKHCLHCAPRSPQVIAPHRPGQRIRQRRSSTPAESREPSPALGRESCLLLSSLCCFVSPFYLHPSPATATTTHHCPALLPTSLPFRHLELLSLSLTIPLRHRLRLSELITGITSTTSSIDNESIHHPSLHHNV